MLRNVCSGTFHVLLGSCDIDRGSQAALLGPSIGPGPVRMPSKCRVSAVWLRRATTLCRFEASDATPKSSRRCSGAVESKTAGGVAPREREVLGLMAEGEQPGDRRRARDLRARCGEARDQHPRQAQPAANRRGPSARTGGAGVPRYLVRRCAVPLCARSKSRTARKTGGPFEVEAGRRPAHHRVLEV
jgi:hypothetical protein